MRRSRWCGWRAALKGKEVVGIVTDVDVNEQDRSLHEVVEQAQYSPCATATLRTRSGVVLKAVGDEPKAQRELLITAQLQVLDLGFGQLRRWTVVDDNTHQRFVVMEFADGGNTLRSAAATLSFDELRDVVFQVMFALFAAQRRFQLVHNDLHADNIIVQRDTNLTGVFSIADGPASSDVRFTTTGIVARVIDMGLAHCLVDNIGMCSSPQQRSGNAPSIDRESLAGVIAATATAIARREKCTPADRCHRSSFLRALRSCSTPMSALLSHPYFDNLRKAPSPDSIIHWSSMASTPTILGPLDRFTTRISKEEAIRRMLEIAHRHHH